MDDDASIVQTNKGVMAGVTLVLFSVLLIAIGANVQRLALRDIPPEARVCGCLSARTMGWFGGLCIYFFANVLYTLGLVYAPASLCATLVAAIIPVNALTSFLILGEVLQLVDVQGGLFITAGILVASYAAPYTAVSYSAADLNALLLAPDSLALLGGLCAVAALLAVAVLLFEWSREDGGRAAASGLEGGGAPVSASATSCLGGTMPFAYPVVVGLLESMVQVFQKGGSSMAVLTAAGDSQMSDPTFWGVVVCWVSFSAAVVWWLRKGLANLAANRMLPIEYGTFTATSVLAGLVVYNEAKYVSSAHRWMMAGGVVLVVIGCGLVGGRRAARCSRCTSDDEEGLASAHEAAERREEQLMRQHLQEHLLPAAVKRSDAVVPARGRNGLT